MWLLFVVYFFGYCFNGTSELGYDQLWLGRPSQVRWGTATSNSPSPSDRPSPSWVYPPVETQTWLAEKSMEITWFHGGFSGTLNENHRTKWRTCLITAGYLYWEMMEHEPQMVWLLGWFMIGFTAFGGFKCRFYIMYEAFPMAYTTSPKWGLYSQYIII